METKHEKLPEKYELISHISSGAFGKVVAVKDRTRRVELALKVLKTFSKRKVKVFKREFARLSLLNHPNLVRVYDYGLLRDGKPYFTMELIHGKDLRSFLKERKNLKYLPDIISQCLSALNYLHSKGVLHGDIKPKNVMVTTANEVKLLDFGLMVRKGMKRKRISGTPGYIAPETIREGIYTESSDLYALGVSLLESIIGRKEFEYKKLAVRLSGAGLENTSNLTSFILSLCSPDSELRPEDTNQAILSFEISSAIKARGEWIDFDRIFVGRRKELRYAEKFLMGKNRKRLLLIKGVVGSGKRSLAREIKKKAQVNGFVTVEFNGRDYVSSPLRNIFESIAHNLEKKESKIFKRKLETIYKAFEQDINDIETKRISRNYLTDLYINLSKLLIKYAARNPVVIFLNDIESFEEDFLRFVVQLEQVLLVEKDNTVLIVCTLNEDKKTKSMEQLNIIESHELSKSLNLGPLTVYELMELVEEVFGRNIFLPSEMELIYKRTRGLPLLVVELLKQLISKGLIVNDNGIWNRKGEIYSNIEALSSIDEIFLNEWNNLNRKEKFVLRTIALYESRLKIDDLAKITCLNSQLISKLINSGILLVRKRYVEIINPLIKDAIIKRTSWKTKKAINFRIASFLESLRKIDIVEIARYYIESNSVNLAYKYGLEAAKILIFRNELYLAYNYLLKLKKVLKVRNENKKLIDVLLPLTELEKLFGSIEVVINDYEFIVRTSRDKRIVANALLQLAILTYEQKGDRKKHYKLLKKAYDLATLIKDKRLISLSLVRLANYMEGADKEKSLIKALNISRTADIDTYSEVVRKLLSYYDSSGKVSLAERYLSEALTVVQKVSYATKLSIYKSIWVYKFYISDYDFIIKYIGNIYKSKVDFLSFTEKDQLARMNAGVYYILGKYSKMIFYLNEAIEILKMQRLYYNLTTAKYNLLLAYRELADYPKCLEILKEIEIIKKEGRIKSYYSPNIMVESKVYSLLGRYFKKKYIKLIRSNKHIILKEKNPLSLGHYYLTLSDNNYFNLHIKRSLNQIENAVSKFRKVRSRDDTCEALLKKSIILCELGQPKKARLYIKQAWNIYEQIHCEYLLPQLLLAKGMVERLNGKDEAIETLREALKVSKKQLTREQTWQIQREMALYYKDKRQFKRALKYYKDAVETIKQITESIPTEEIKLSYLEVPFRKRVFDEIKELKKLIVK